MKDQTKPAAELVLARVYRRAADRESAGPFAVLIWPMEAADYDGKLVTCWHYVGQHSGVSLRYLLDATRPATVAEAAGALHQWRSEGPARGPDVYPLRLRRRCPPWHVMAAFLNPNPFLRAGVSAPNPFLRVAAFRAEDERQDAAGAPSHPPASD